MSVLTVSGTDARGSMLEYQRPSAARIPPYREQRPGHRQSYSPTALPQFSTSQIPSSHRHSRSTSSSALPYNSDTLSLASAQRQTSQANSAQPQSRRASSGNFSPSTTMNNIQYQATTGSNYSTAPRRSTSSRSSVTTNNPTSYVALMRKQKATVWCDRAQNIDPRLAAQQRAAKQRAVMEVHGGNGNAAGRTSTISSGGVVGKIRHGGVPKASSYVPANLSGAVVPMRLSANEMVGDEDEQRSLGDDQMAHGRSGSGKSSTNSAKYRSGYPRPDPGRYSGTSTPPSGAEGDVPEVAETPGGARTHSTHQIESEDSFGDLREMTGPSAVISQAEQAKKAEDLRRRGSVDERAMSMSTGVRLFVANP